MNTGTNLINGLGSNLIILFPFHMSEEFSLTLIETQIIKSIENIISHLWYLIDHIISYLLNVFSKLIIRSLSFLRYNFNQRSQWSFYTKLMGLIARTLLIRTQKNVVFTLWILTYLRCLILTFTLRDNNLLTQCPV